MGQQVDDLWMGAATGPQTSGWASSGNPGVIGQGVGPLGRTYVFDIVPATLSATAVCAAQAVAAAGNATINGASAAGGVGNGKFEPWAFRYKIRLARSSGLPKPAKVILVPGAYFLGLANHLSMPSQSQLPGMLFSASE